MSDDFDDETLPGEKIDVQHYLRILRKNKWAITFFTLIVTALAGYYAYTATPIYESTSTLLIESQKANIISVQDLYGVEKESSDYYQTQYEILQSRSLAARVVRKLGIERIVPEADGGAQPASASSGSESGAASFATAAKSAFSDIISTADNAPATSDPALPAGAAMGEEQTGSSEFFSGRSVELPADQILDSYNADLQLPYDANLASAISVFSSNLTITPVRSTKLVRIGYQSEDPVFAAEVANTVASEYISSVLDGRMYLKEKASSWMNERVALLKENVDASESRLITFKQENGLIDVNGSVGRLNEQELLLATTELAQARSELSDAQDVYREVANLQRSAPELLKTMPAIQDDPLVRAVEIEFGQRKRELDELSNVYGERHPRKIEAQSRLDSLSQTLEGHIVRVVGAIQKDVDLRRQRVQAIETTLSQGKNRIQDIGEKKFGLDALEREVETNRNIYNQFFSRITETNSADGLDEANARISDFAVPMNSPVKPKKQLIIALAALASLILSVLMALLYEQMDETIKGADDVEKGLGIRLLGIVPLMKKGMFSSSKDLPLNPLQIVDKKGTFAESIKTIRTTLSMIEGDTPKVILITSSVPGEGKSSTSFNLAYSFSQLEKVLLIDCDLRRPSLAKSIDLPKNAEGLTNLITRTAEAKDCIRRGAVGSLDLMTSGPLPQQPLELLCSSRFEKILEQLSRHYDRIIIDSAPAQVVSDALVLGKMADAVVYVVKSHDTPRNTIARGIARLREAKAPVVGVVIAQVDVEKISGYGGDHYYQGYYDYYGYNDKDGGRSDDGAGAIRLTPEELRNVRQHNDDVELDLEEFLGTSNGAGNRHKNNGRVVEDEYDNGEFDLTADLSDSAAAATRPTRAHARSKDLDIL